jgi:hypothetical protein
MNSFNNQFATQRLREEGSVTGTGATFTPGTGEQAGPIATKKIVRKKLKPEQKDVEPKLAAGKAKIYMKDKWGWKDAPSIPNRPSKGGFIYKQLFEELSNFMKEIDPQYQPDEDDDDYGSDNPDDDYGPTIKDEKDNSVLDEANVPDNIKRFAQKKGVSSFVNKVASWAEKAGARITGGTAIGKNYDTLVLDMGYQTADIYINIPEQTIELYGQEVNSFPEFKQVFMDQMTKDQMSNDEDQYRRETGLEEDTENDYWTNKTVKIVKGMYAGNTGEVVGAGDGEVDIAVGPQKKIITVSQDEVKIVGEINESYSRFKNETKTRGKSDQFHQAVREVRKKVQEINKLFEYVSRLKSELSEGEGGLKYKVHTEKALAKIKEMVTELNQNIKKFK